MRIFNKDFIIDLQKTILWQYDKAQSLRSLINQKQSWYKRNVTDFILNFFKNIFNLKTATDFGLSVWGKLLNFPRQIFLNKYQIEAEQTVGIDLTDIEVARVTFNSKIGSGDDFTATTIETGEYKTFIFTYDGSNWDITGSVSASDVDISDYGVTFEGTPAEDDQITIIADYEAVNLTTEQYRFLLLGQILKFNMSCTLPEINRYLRLIFDQENNDNVYVTDNHNMTITYTIQPPVLSSDIQKLVNNYDFLPTPAGVKINTSTSTLYTLTINTTPADATVILTVDGENYNQHSIDIEYGTVVNWSITKENYISQSGTQVITENTTLTKTLEYLGDILSFYGEGEISYYMGMQRDIKYSINGSDWQNWDGSTLTIQSASRIYVKGNNPDGLNYGSSSDLHFNITGFFTVRGRVTSLLTDNGDDLSEIPSSYCFYKLFESCSGITTVGGLNLSSKTLKSNCYSYMFANCTNLSGFMVSGLRNVINFATNCCSYMFANCSSLRLNSEIICNTNSILADSCFSNMFVNCISLGGSPRTPHLLSNSLAYRCYNEMFRGCTGMYFAPELPATQLADSCYRLMFYGCTSLSKAPYLPATNLVTACYSQMFETCSSLNEIRIAYTGIFGQYIQGGSYFAFYTGSWLRGVSSDGSFYYNGSDTTRGVSAIPQNWIIRTF